MNSNATTIDDHFPNAKSLIEKLSRSTLRPNSVLTKSLHRNGFKKAIMTFCITTLSKDQLSRGRIWSPTPDVLAYALPLEFDAKDITRPVFYQTSADGFLQTQATSFQRRLEGKIMNLVVGTSLSEFPEDPEYILNQTITQMRLMGGIGAVSEVIQSVHVRPPDTACTQSFILSNSLPYWHLRAPHEDDSWDDCMSVFNYTTFNVSREASELLKLAVEQDNLSVRFLLLWLAFECQAGKGPKARQVLQREGAGKPILDLLEELKKIRSDFAHYGKPISGKSTLLKMFLLFRLVCISDSEQFRLAHSHVVGFLNSQRV